MHGDLTNDPFQQSCSRITHKPNPSQECTNWYTRTIRVENVIHINAPIEHVWDLTMDVETWPEITPTMTRVELLDSPLDLGSEARIKQPGQRERTWTVTELEPTRSFAWSTNMVGLSMTGAHHLEATSGGTNNTLIVEVDGPLAPILGPLMKRPIAKAIAAENEGFREAAER